MSTRGRTIRLGTRGSDLALRQAAEVKERLEGRRHEVELVTVETRGDRIRDELIHRLGKTGAFVRSLDETVLAGELDGAVHSMKDVPTEQPDELIVAGIPERAPAADVLVTPDGTDLDGLAEGATVGTSSLRRRAQLLADRPDLRVEPLRGNVDTRVEKLLAPTLQREHERRLAAETDDGSEGDESAGADEGDGDGPDAADGDAAFEHTAQEWFEGLAAVERRALERAVDTEFDAIVLAEAGLVRSGLDRHVEHRRLPAGRFVPAPGQGALAVTSLDTEVGAAIHDAVDHPPTRVAATVERVVLGALGGGCVAPIGVNAVVRGEVVHTAARVLDRDGTEEVAATRDLPVERHAEAAREFAADLRERGAAALVREARRTADDRRAKRAEDGNGE